MIVNDFLNLLYHFLSVRRDDCLMNNMLAGISIGYDVIKTSISLKYTRDIPLGIQVIVTIIELSPISLFPQRLPS